MGIYQIQRYLFITFSLCILLSLIVGLTGGHESNWKNAGYLAMFIPAIAVLLLRNQSKAGFSYPAAKGFTFKWLALALFIFPLIIHVVCLPVVALQNNSHIPWQPWLSAGSDGLFHSPPERNWGAVTKTGLVFRIVLNAVTGLVVVSVLAFFEEVGWRAWLLPRLTGRFSVKKGLLISAVVIALWHMPFSLSGIHYIANAPMPIVIIFYSLGQMGAATIIGWFWVRTRSIWIVSIAHGSLNNWGQYAFKYINDTGSAKDTAALIIALNLSLLLGGLVILFLLKGKNISTNFN
jgi:membrane protease YdiL (CAAX protease family)